MYIEFFFNSYLIDIPRSDLGFYDNNASCDVYINLTEIFYG